MKAAAKAPDYASLPTERAHPASRALDRIGTEGVVRLMNREDAGIPRAVAGQVRNIAQAAELAAGALKRGGRLFIVGAGTSGRLGVLEAAECPPTFGTPPTLVQAIIAGGRAAVFRSREGAEDRAGDARRALAGRLKKRDTLIGIAASGVTPYARAALETARKKGAGTILVTCNAGSALKSLARVVIAPDVGPEVIAGSTRLKSGTATKMVLNMLTTAAMVRLGKVHGNLMVDLRPGSKKLVERGIRLVGRIAGLPRGEAGRLFAASGGNVKTAVIMARRGTSSARAGKILRSAGGLLSRALRDQGGSHD